MLSEKKNNIQESVTNGCADELLNILLTSSK